MTLGNMEVGGERLSECVTEAKGPREEVSEAIQNPGVLGFGVREATKAESFRGLQ